MVGFRAVPGPQFSYGLQAGHNGTASSVLSHKLEPGYGRREFSSFWAHESLSLTGETKPTGYLPFGRYWEVGCPLFHQLHRQPDHRSAGLAHQCSEVLGTPVHWLALLAHQSFLSSLARLTRFWSPPSPGPTGHQSGYWFTRLVLHQFTGCGAPVWLLVTPGWALDWPRLGLALTSLH